MRLLLLTLVAWAGAAAAGPKVASINMCTDQLVLALADDDQILGLSHLARDPALSFHHRRAARFPVLSGQAEDVLPLRPEIVFTATFAKAETRGMLARAGLRLEAFDNARTIAEAREQIARMGRLLDQQARAAAALARLDAALGRLAARGAARPLSVLPLERRGWITGRESLLNDLLAVAHIRNLGAEVMEVGGQLPLERIVALAPDRLLLNTSATAPEDQGAALLHHPALGKLFGTPPLIVPERLTVCGGPMLAEAADLIADDLSRDRPAPAAP